MKKPLFFLGDIHGNLQVVQNLIKKYDLRDCIIIQVGDFGIGFERENKELNRLIFLNKTLKNRNIEFYVLRGNHDDPSYFTGKYQLSNLKLMPDYSVIINGDSNILLVGGAISVDRITRKEGSSWWAKEKFVLDSKKLEHLKNFKIDIVATHNAPRFCYPQTTSGIPQDYINRDPKLLTDVENERNELSNFYEILKKDHTISYWYYGHFHYHHLMVENDTVFCLLDINEMKEFYG